MLSVKFFIIAEQREGWQGMQLQGFFSPAPHISKQTQLPFLTFNYFFKLGKSQSD